MTGSVNAFVDNLDATFEALGPLGGLDPATGNVWRVKIYSEHSSLEPVWRRMESEGSCLVFQTYDWISCWYDTARLVSEAEPLIVAVFRETAEPTWILPLCLHKKNNLRVVSFADLGVSDYAAPLIGRDAPSDPKVIQDILEAVFDALPPCDLINLQKLPADVDGRPNPLMCLPGLERFPADCHGIRLCEPWPDLAKKIMNRRLRSGVRNKREELRAHGEVAIKCYGSRDLGDHMEELLAIRNERFEAIGRSGMSSFWRTFYQILASREGRSYSPSITSLTVAGQTIATCFSLLRGKTNHVLLATFRMGKWEAFRPGIILFDDMLTTFGRQAGKDAYFDFTVGDEEYKRRMGSESHPLYEWMAVRSFSGLPAYTAWRVKAALRRHPWLYTRLQNWMQKIKACKAIIMN